MTAGIYITIQIVRHIPYMLIHDLLSNGIIHELLQWQDPHELQHVRINHDYDDYEPHIGAIVGHGIAIPLGQNDG